VSGARRAVVLLAALGVAAPLRAQQTRAERTDARETSSYADVLAFLDSLEHAGAGIRVGTLGTSPEGKRIPYVVAARPLVSSPAEAERSGKPVVWIQGNIHAGEVEGKEVAQMLLRDLTLGPLRPLLDSVVLLVVPIYNADGNDHFAPGDVNRPGQSGPAIVGRNTNGQGLNLNRDYVKLEAPETRGELALLAAWDPDVFVDLHTTNGSYHGYALTYATGLNPNSAPLNEWAYDRFLPTIRERMRKRHHEETYWYGNFRNQEPDSLAQGWETYDPRPRFGVNLLAMRNRLAVLSEGYSNNPFADRIRATYDFVHEILSLTAERKDDIARLLRASDRRRPDSVAVRSTYAPPRTDEVVAEITHDAGEGANGYARRQRTGVFRAIRMPVFDRFAPTRIERRPAAYLLRAEHAPLVELLRRQGVLVERLAEPWRGPLERFTLDTVMAAAAPFEGHRTVTVEGRWAAPADGDIPAGSYLVRTDQPLGTLAAYLLEPASEDGFVAWNFLDRELRRHEEYPILRTGADVRAAYVEEP
jgi:hypothetical protein